MAAALLFSTPVLAQSAKTGPDTPVSVTAEKLAPPANDNFAAATVISGDGQSLSTTIEATQETGEPVILAACATGDSNQSVWFKFIAGTTGSATFDTNGSVVATPPGPAGQFTDTIMSIYTGSAIGSLTQVACNDDDPTNTATGDFTSRIVTNITTGTTYYVRVSSFLGGSRHNGEVRLTYTGLGAGTTPTGPSITASPTSVAFGTVTTGTSSAATTVTVTNNGDAAATISSITVSGTGFTINQTGTDLTLDPAQTTTFTVTFSPTTAGAATGTVTIASNDPGSPDTVALTGTGQAPGGPATYTESGDVGNLPGTAGDASDQAYVSIQGSSTPVQDVDMFRIYIASPSTFSATTNPAVAGGMTDTRLFLFKADGSGVYYNDDTVGATNFLSTLPAGDPNGPTAPGIYYIAVSGYPMMAEDATGQNMFCEGVSADAGPGTCIFRVVLPAVDADPVTQWTRSGTTNPGVGAYNIRLTGLGAVSTAAEPLPSGEAFRLSAATPNPVRDLGFLTLTVAQTQDVQVAVYDALGRQVAVLHDGLVASGEEVAMTFRSADLAPGLYVVRAVGEGFQTSQRITVAH